MSALSFADGHVYAYRFSSQVDGGAIHLAATGGIVEAVGVQPGIASTSEAFFEGRLRRPREMATMLRTLSHVVRTHFFDARPPQMDPIVTSSKSLVRWEGFSGCCGAYARLDLDMSAFETRQRQFGTTNVDFNPAMLAQLARVGTADDVQLSIASDSVILRRNDSQVLEKRVTLPRRWIRGLCEVQVYQSRLGLRHRFSPGTIMHLLHSVSPKTGGEQYLMLAGGKPRLAGRRSDGAVSVGGARRLEVLRTLLPVVREVSLYCDGQSGVHAWLAETDGARFWLVLSPTLQRGFSGEGQVLEALSNGKWQTRIAAVRELLAGASHHSANDAPLDAIDPAELAARLGCSVAEARDALAALATNGLAGFDAASGYYFQRQLPFDLERVPRDQPRLRAARTLVQAGAAKVLGQIDATSADVEVISGDTTYLVRVRREGSRCSCPWFSRHQGERGPCKHVLAAQMLLGSTDGH